jgi:hypothetical protein
MTRTAARTGVVAALVLAAGLLATAPVSAQSSAAPRPAASTTCATSRPHNGTTLYSKITGGLGTLTVVNKLSQDSVVVLVRGSSKAISVYVRAHKHTTVRNVKEGRYVIYFGTGSGYSACQGRFTLDAAYYRVGGHVRFVAYPYYSTDTLTLYAVNGNASDTQIPPNQFP